MSEHNRKRRLGGTKKYKTKVWKHLTFQPPGAVSGFIGPPRPPIILRSSTSSEPRQSSNAIEESDLEPDVVPIATSVVAEYPDIPTNSWGGEIVATYDEYFEDAIQPEPAVLSVWDHVGSGAYDPFHTGHTQMTERMMQHLRNCEWPHV